MGRICQPRVRTKRTMSASAQGVNSTAARSGRREEKPSSSSGSSHEISKAIPAEHSKISVFLPSPTFRRTCREKIHKRRHRQCQGYGNFEHNHINAGAGSFRQRKVAIAAFGKHRDQNMSEFGEKEPPAGGKNEIKGAADRLSGGVFARRPVRIGRGKAFVHHVFLSKRDSVPATIKQNDGIYNTLYRQTRSRQKTAVGLFVSLVFLPNCFIFMLMIRRRSKWTNWMPAD